MTRGRSLSEEGFIHASTAAQVLPVANAVYHDEPQDLVLLVLEQLGRARSAASRYRLGRSFPHIYGPLDVAAVVQRCRWSVTRRGASAGPTAWPTVTGPPAPGRPVSDRRVLYVVACAAPPAADVSQLVSLAQRRGWDVCVLTTPSARRFTDTAALERQTGHPVRSEYKNPGEPDVLPDRTR